jgi:hypothetical protein
MSAPERPSYAGLAILLIFVVLVIGAMLPVVMG